MCFKKKKPELRWQIWFLISPNIKHSETLFLGRLGGTDHCLSVQHLFPLLIGAGGL